MRKVKDIIEHKLPAFNFIEPSALVIDALKLMNSMNTSYLIVKDGDNYKGIFCEKDYTRNVILKGRHSDSTKVEEVMTTDLPVVEMDDSVEHCMMMMNSFRTLYLLVFSNEVLRGVITINDILRQIIACREEVFDTHEIDRLLNTKHKARVY